MKYFLVYTHGESREDYNVFYSTLVIAKTEEEAIQKFCDLPIMKQHNTLPSDFGDEDKNYGIEEVDPVI